MSKAYNLGAIHEAVILAIGFLRSKNIGPESIRALEKLNDSLHQDPWDAGPKDRDFPSVLGSGEITRLMTQLMPVIRHHAACEELFGFEKKASGIESALSNAGALMVRNYPRTGVAIDNEVRDYLKAAHQAMRDHQTKKDSRTRGLVERFTAVSLPQSDGEACKQFKNTLGLLKTSGLVTSTFLSMSRPDGGTMGDGFEGTRLAARMIAQTAGYKVVRYNTGGKMKPLSL